MPDELPPIPNTFQAPSGALTKTQRRWIVGGIIGGMALLMVFTAHSPSTVAPKQMGPKQPPVSARELQPQTRTYTPPYIQPLPTYQPPPATYGTPVVPEKTERDKLREEREAREERSAFADNIVARAEDKVTSTKGGAREESTNGENAGRGMERPSARNTFTLPEGTVIPGVLINKLNGENVGPVEVQVSSDVYIDGTRTIVIPQGSHILGEANKVSGFGQDRLAVSFHRILVGTGPAMYSVSLDKAPGLDQEGATALHDKVNSHYASIFGASLAIGAIGGLAQIGNGFSGIGYSPEVEFRNGVTQSMAQSSARVLDRFLQRMPTITIRPGTRVDVYLMGDLQLPAYGQ